MSVKWEIESLIFSGHALRQLFARRIAVDDIKSVIESGEAIATYPDDRPYPSKLLMGFSAGNPLHVVLAYNRTTKTAYVVTAYVPDAGLWSDDYKRRRNS